MGLFDGVGKTLQKNLNDIMASRGMVPLHELVRRIHEGDSSKWHEAATKANSVVEAHQDASERSMKMLQVLESSWTGEGADAAAEKIRAGAKATEMAAAVYAANARRYTDSAYTFDNVKQQLPPIPETPPERDFIDVLTPWDTDNEKQVNQYKADVQRARQIYDGYEQAMRSAQQGVVQDFGRFDSFDTGDRELGTIERSESRQAESSGTGVKTFHEPGPSVSAGAPVSGGAPTPSPISGGAVPSGSAPSLQSPTPVASSQPNGSTSLSGYVPPDVNRPTPGYSPPNLNPTTGFGPGSGGGGTSNTPGFGPVGTTGGFGPAGGGSSTVGGLRGRLPGPGLGGVPGGIGPGGAGGAAEAAPVVPREVGPVERLPVRVWAGERVRSPSDRAVAVDPWPPVARPVVHRARQPDGVRCPWGPWAAPGAAGRAVTTKNTSASTSRPPTRRSSSPKTAKCSVTRTRATSSHLRPSAGRHDDRVDQSHRAAASGVAAPVGIGGPRRPTPTAGSVRRVHPAKRAG